MLIHEIWGLVPHIRDIADRYAAEGYLVLAPDLLSDAGITPEIGAELAALRHEPDEEKRLQGQALLREKFAVMNEPAFAAEAITKLRLVVDALAAEPGIDGRIAVTGFCFGGTYSFALAAADPRVRAAIPFYGASPDAASVARIAAPVLALYGEDDPRIMAALPQTRIDMAAAGVDFTDRVYPGRAARVLQRHQRDRLRPGGRGRCLAARPRLPRPAPRPDATLGRMSRTLVTILGVIAAVVIAWFLVDFLFSFIYLVVRLIIVAVIAVLVFFALRGVFARSDRS